MPLPLQVRRDALYSLTTIHPLSRAQARLRGHVVEHLHNAVSRVNPVKQFPVSHITAKTTNTTKTRNYIPVIKRHSLLLVPSVVSIRRLEEVHLVV